MKKYSIKRRLNKSNVAFTLIELIAVLVILAMLILIVTPLVLNIIKKAKDSAMKRSVDGYGHAVELAIAKYMMHNGSIPDNLEYLDIQYNGNNVICDVMALNPDGSLYLADCSVDGKKLSNYFYGEDVLPDYKKYVAGEIVKYNNMQFYVAENSNKKNEYVTLLKADALRYNEVSEYFDEIEIKNSGGYAMTKYGDTIDYNNSNVKKLVDKWALLNLESSDYISASTLSANSLHYLGFIWKDSYGAQLFIDGDKYNWLYGSNYSYWTMAASDDSEDLVTVAYSDKYIRGTSISYFYAIRPVVKMKKSAL